MARTRRTSVRRAVLAAVVVLLGGSAAVVAEGGASANHEYEVVAHRGGTDGAPESTRAAFARAIRLGADAIEFDVRFTSDRRPVVMHDFTLDRTTNCSGAVSRTSWAEVRRCDAGSWYSSAFRGERVPSLSEALTFIANRSSSVAVYVHVRPLSDSDARQVVRAIEQRGMNNGRATVIAGTTRDLQRMDAAGANRLGHVFNNRAGWSTDYPVLVPHNAPLTDDLIATAQRRGQRVLPVEGKPATLKEMAGSALDGFLANDLARAMDLVGRGERDTEPARDRKEERDRDTTRTEDRNIDPETAAEQEIRQAERAADRAEADARAEAEQAKRDARGGGDDD